MPDAAQPVVTGIGVVAPNGLGTKEFWERTLDGRSGLDVIRRFDASGYPVQVGGEVLDFDPGEHLPKRLLPQTDRMTQYALAATDWALTDAGVETGELDEYVMGVVTASASGGFEFGQRELEKLWGTGPDRVSAYQSFAWFYAVNTGQISIRNGMRGHSSVLVSEQAGGLDAAAHASRLLARGTIHLAVTGGLDASLCPWGLVAQLPPGRLSTVPDPRTAYRPFTPHASGYVAGEGGAILVVEPVEAARARGAAKTYGRIAGHASTFDPRPGSGRPSALAPAIRGALDRAGLRPSEVDVVFADAMGLPELDRAEAAALAEVFGPRGVPVTAPKTMTGRLYAGGAALDLACALLSLQESVVPPTIGVPALAPAIELDLVRDQPRELPIRNALVVARGHGGFNSALVVQRTDQ
ncbi:ketosynthase chain-length factor [Amycolatopsis anabasis]|uniref:ketosynthase chain-length factor n=1 Tax=Amycolatopsis anabasis TaxID=1840409 RepID=UPI00131CB6DD|nr:ketosynthase chain-length factor [Amycolatopsis anabasis]